MAKRAIINKLTHKLKKKKNKVSKALVEEGHKKITVNFVD